MHGSLRNISFEEDTNLRDDEFVADLCDLLWDELLSELSVEYWVLLDPTFSFSNIHANTLQRQDKTEILRGEILRADNGTAYMGSVGGASSDRRPQIFRLVELLQVLVKWSLVNIMYGHKAQAA